MSTTKQLAKYDPKIEGAALALLDKMSTALGLATTVGEKKDIHSLAKLAQARAMSLPAYNKAGALVIAAEVSMGQDLLKQRAPAKGGGDVRGKNTSGKNPEVSAVPLLKEILMAPDTPTANDWAREYRELASKITPEELRAAESLATKADRKLTRRLAVQLVRGVSEKDKKSETPKKAITISSAWGMLSEANEAELAALQWLKDHGAQVDVLLQHARAIAGAIRKERQK